MKVMGEKGFTSLVVTVVVIVLIILAVFIIFSFLQVYKAQGDYIQWQEEMGRYEPPYLINNNTTSGPSIVGYCLVNNVNGTTYVSCP